MRLVICAEARCSGVEGQQNLRRGLFVEQVATLSKDYSHCRAVQSLNDWLKKEVRPVTFCS